MMCDEMLNLMLEADPETLEGGGDSVVAAHLQSCLHCQTVAAQLLAAHEHDATGYFAVTPRQAPHAVASKVFAAAGTDAPAGQRRSAMRTVGFGLVPIGAAALLMLVIHTRRDARRDALQASIDAAFAAPIAVTSVKVPPGRNAIVFKTQDPNISVVWIY